ncbi:MAG: PD-(D/E)XK nuclease family protein [Candidatus Sericytochromatia bacterium]
MKPNIFEIATKELSQDAFITWLLKYGDNSCNSIDSKLNLCAIEFINLLIRKSIPNFNEKIEKVVAKRQWKNIDIKAEINDKFLIIIEDKTNSGKRNNQLERYKNIASKWCIDNNYEPPICIYLKTGNESQRDLNEIKKEGFSIFNRQDFIILFNNHNEIDNDIFVDFRDNIERKDKLNIEFTTKKIGDWKPYDYVGFYQLLETKMKILNWHYVDNPNGGFWNALLSWSYLGIYPTYLQIEEQKLCFKISTNPEDVVIPANELRKDIRNKINKIILDKAKQNNLLEIIKPRQFGHGNYMTVAIVERDYWLGKSDDFVDVNNVVNNLKKYLLFMANYVGVK